MKKSKYRFNLKECEEIRKEYENQMISTVELSKKYGVGHTAILKAIRRADGEVRDVRDCHRKFTIEQSIKIKDEYVSGVPIFRLTKKYKCSDTAIRNAISFTGGKFRPQGYDRRKFFRNPNRERNISCGYQLKVSDTDWMLERQKGLCLWCQAPLPGDSLLCTIDHIYRGKRKGLSNRNNVRGLSCPDNLCNQLAGRIEANKITKKDWGLLSAYVNHVRFILKTNKGNLLFPPTVVA